MLIETRYDTRNIDSKGDADTYPWRVLYADHVPVQEWTVWSGQTQQEVFVKARTQAARDLIPSRGVETNVFIVQRWNEDENRWDGDDENGDDLTDLAFEEDR